MSSLLNLLADDKKLIIYRAELNNITGSVTATILLQQMLYWYKTNNYKKFYKFKDSCNHSQYKRGDSWLEELGFSRREFDTALKKLEDKGLVSHKTNSNRLTFYDIDIKKLDIELEKTYTDAKVQNALYLKAESAFTKSANPPLYISETTRDNNINVDSKESTTKSKINKQEYSKEFEILWNLYSKKSSNKKRSYEVYKKRWKSVKQELLKKAIESYKDNTNPLYLKDFDGFLNGIIDSYIPQRAWIKDKRGSVHNGFYVEHDNKFISDSKNEFSIESNAIASYLENGYFGYINNMN